MPSLPVLVTVSKAFAFLGLNLRLLTVWTVFPLLLTLVALGLCGLVAWLFKHWLPMVPGVIFTLFVWGPYSVRVNQLVITGRPWEGAYLPRIFESTSLRYVGYSYLLMAVYTLGLGLAVMPAVIGGAKSGLGAVSGTGLLGFTASAGLALAFVIMIAPLNLICPATCVEQSPKLSAAYNLGANVKMRLLAAVAVPHVLFTLLSTVLDVVASKLGGGQGVLQNLVLLPAQLVLAFFGCVVNMAVPALVYRHLRGLPDPAQAKANPEAPWPGPSI